MAVVEALLPGPNVVAALARIHETLRRLDPHGPGLGYLNVAWFIGFAPWVAFALYSRFARLVFGTAEMIHELAAVLPFFWLGATISLVLILLAVVRVERLCAARQLTAST